MMPFTIVLYNVYYTMWCAEVKIILSVKQLWIVIRYRKNRNFSGKCSWEKSLSRECSSKPPSPLSPTLNYYVTYQIVFRFNLDVTQAQEEESDLESENSESVHEHYSLHDTDTSLGLSCTDHNSDLE